MKRYDLFIPMGSRCFCSYNMRKAGLQEGSLPFDWIFNVPFKVAVWYVSNDFKDFLNYDYLKKSSKLGNESTCIYENIKTGIEFYHDFCQNGNMIKELPGVREKYNRRIERLYNKINKSKKILLIHMTTESSDVNEINDELIKFRKLYPNKKIDLLLIELKDNQENINIDNKYFDYYLSKENNSYGPSLNWVGDVEEIGKILRPYDFTLRHKVKSYFIIFLQKYKKYTLKFIFNLIPSKKFRKQLRVKFKIKSADDLIKF